MRLHISQKLLLTYFLAVVVYWFYLRQTGYTDDFHNYFYSFVFSLIPLVGGFVGMFASKAWGALKSAVGRTVFYLSAGLFSWGAGSMVWSYYNFFQDVAAPYPSIADVGFVLSLPFWAMAAVNLSKATGAKFALKKFAGKAALIVMPLIVMAASYYLLVTVARGGVLTQSFDNYLKLALDIAYPFGDVIILTIVTLILGLSFKYFGGQYRLAIYSILFGLGFMYLADFVFSYTTTVGTFFVGHWGDLLFTVALFLLTFGALGFFVRPKEIEGAGK